MIRNLALAIFGSIILANHSWAENDTYPVFQILAPNENSIAMGVENVSAVEKVEDGSSYRVAFRIDEVSRQKLSELTAANVGQKISLRVCGEDVSNPNVVEPITGSALVVTGFTEAKADAIVDVLTGDTPCEAKND